MDRPMVTPDQTTPNTASECRSCGSTGLEPILSLGTTPLANSLLTGEMLERPEPRYPLALVFCPGCTLVQLTLSVPPEAMFEEYAYFSSFADTVVENARAVAERLVRERGLGRGDLAMEIASNDGYLLRNYVDAGISVLGIDPARNVAAVAERNGVPTLCDFFGPAVAERLRAEGRRASVLHANNVLAHVPDVNGVVAGIARILTDDGVAVIETPYVRDLVDELEFDTIYHEHLFYYSLHSLAALFARNGLEIVDLEHLPIHGGSLRVFVAHAGSTAAGPAVGSTLAAERDAGLTSLGYYRDFAAEVDRLCDDLRTLLASLKEAGATIAAYGAAAKGATLLNYSGIGTETLDFVADRNVHKQGRYMPGVHLPIVDPSELLERRPDYLLLLAWNFADEIMAQQAAYAAGGGRFIVPVPEPRVVDVVR
jgi:SAM-dependent methyltransferase